MNNTPMHKIILCLSLMLWPILAIAENRNNSFSQIKSPDIPSKVEFAGQTISMDNPNMMERYDRELSTLAYTHGNMLLTFKRANKLFPLMAPVLKENGIPLDLLYLACVESYLNQTAVSGAKAAGIWQLIPAVGRELGLEVNDNVDERYDIVKSTAAACRILKRAYNKYGNWETAAASYNGGQGRISRELDAQHVDSAFDLWLTNETARYIFRLLAMKEIMENPSRYGYSFTPGQLYQPDRYDVVAVDSTITSWPDWAKEHGIDYRTLRQHNPWIRSRQLPNDKGKTYEVLIPTADSRSRKSQPTEIYNKHWISSKDD